MTGQHWTPLMYVTFMCMALFMLACGWMIPFFKGPGLIFAVVDIAVAEYVRFMMMDEGDTL